MANSNPDGAFDVAVTSKPNRVRPAILMIFNNPVVRTPRNDKAKRSRQSVRDSLLQVRKSLTIGAEGGSRTHTTLRLTDFKNVVTNTHSALYYIHFIESGSQSSR